MATMETKPYLCIDPSGRAELVWLSESDDVGDNGTWLSPVLGPYHHSEYLRHVYELIVRTAVSFTDTYGDLCWNVPLLNTIEQLGVGTYHEDHALVLAHFDRVLAAL